MAKKKKATVRAWEQSLGLSADWMNDPAREDEIVKRFRRMLNSFHRMYEAQAVCAAEGSDVTITVSAASAKNRPILGPDGEILTEGDPGVEPWKP